MFDNGPGVKPDAAARLFEPFTQQDSSITRTHGGTGLGLAISRRLAHLMGGEIGVRMAGDGGSVFWFTCKLRSDTDVPSLRLVGFAQQKILLVAKPGRAMEDLRGRLTQMGLSVQAIDGSDDTPTSVAQAACALVHESAGEWAYRRLAEHAVHVSGTSRFGVVWVGTPHHFIPAGQPSVLSPPRDEALVRALRVALGVQGDLRSEPPREYPSTSVRAGLHVLVVDDNSTNLLLAQRMLQHMGHQVDLASDGVEAVRLARHAAHDVVLMDMEMPVMDGLEATREIRALSGHCETVPIVALTAHVTPSHERACREAGMNAFLTKPFDREELGRVLDSLTIARRAMP